MAVAIAVLIRMIILPSHQRFARKLSNFFVCQRTRMVKRDGKKVCRRTTFMAGLRQETPVKAEERR